MNIVYGYTPYFTKTGLARREVRGVILHDTETDWTVKPHSQGSWHYEIGRDGEILQFVDEADCAWQVRACDRWWPEWLPRTQPWPVSPANCWTIGIELVSSANYRDEGDDDEDGGPYTDEQYASLRWLLADIKRRYGALPLVGHGQLQLDRSDPVALDWDRLVHEDEGDDEVDVTTVQELRAEIDRLTGVIDTLTAERDYARQEWANRDSVLGALRAHELEPAKARIAALEWDLTELRDQLATHVPVAKQVVGVRHVAVFADGSTQEL